MKKYIDQIFYEGLGRSVYYPIEKLIGKINNRCVKNVFTFIVKCIYFIVAITISVMLFYFVK